MTLKEKDLNSEILAATPLKMPKALTTAAVIFIIAGIIGFILAATGPQAARAWQVFLVNMLFWSGISQSGIVFSAIQHITNGRWGLPVKRIAEGLSAFLPVSFVLFFLIIVGRHYLFPWIGQATEAANPWLNFPFLFSRDLIALIVLGVLGMAYLYFSLRPDVGLLLAKGMGGNSKIHRMLTRGWRGLEGERKRTHEALSVLSVIFILAYVAVFSLLAVDLVMSLDPYWYSTLIGGHFFIGNIYMGLAFITIVAIIVRKYYQLEEYITIDHLHDMGKFIFGFCMLTGDFMWSQYLVIWYGNLEHESSFILVRVFTQPWRSLSIFVMIVAILVPFLLLIPKSVKRHPHRLFIVVMVIVVAMWFERFLLVVPSLWKEGTFPLGWVEGLVTLGFLGGIMLLFSYFIKHFPLLPISDTRLKKGYHISHTY